MLEKEIAELFSLCRKVIRETNSFVRFETCSNADYPICKVYIIDGISARKKDGYDGAYYIFGDEKLRESSLEDYRKATEHLTRLLEENGS